MAAALATKWPSRSSTAHTLWGAVSRGVRVPSEFERDAVFQLGQLPGPIPTYLTLFGNPNLKAEAMRTYEAGYRLQPTSFLSLDADIFYNHYDNLVNLDLTSIGTHGAPIVNPAPLFVEIPAPWQNLGPGQTHGAKCSPDSSPSLNGSWLLA